MINKILTMFPLLNDQHAAEELRWLFALLVTKLWVTSFWFGAWTMDRDMFRGIVVLLAGIRLVNWMIWLYHWLDDVWDWFFLSRAERERKQWRARLLAHVQ